MTDAKTNNPERKPNWAWVWLAYTGFLFIDPFFEPSLYLWLGTLAVLGIFVLMFRGYIRNEEASAPIRHWMIVGTMALGLVTYPWNTGATTFFVYAAAFLPFTYDSLRRVFALFLLEASLVLAEGYIFHNAHSPFHVAWPNTFVAIFLMAIIGGGNIYYAQQKRADCKLRAAQEENMALAAVAERERIARDLHDVLGHTLSLIVLKSELAGRLLENDARDPQRARTEIADVERIARTALAEVREAIGGYRSRGLGAEIEAARRTLDAAGVTLVIDSDDHQAAANLTAPEETALALSLREAVTNIVRHARATTCHLRFDATNGHRRLIIEDDGQHPITREGNGLRGMRERLESLGGHLSLERDRGTRLLIDLPLRTESAIS